VLPRGGPVRDFLPRPAQVADARPALAYFWVPWAEDGPPA